ncbi:MAG: septal ring lytic transglycosylase RlpA family protein [Methylotenera sp.]|nr:septal ring lytic transglycosylase RlpA family protein [Methylotenera sp.]
MALFQQYVIVISITLLTACGGKTATKSSPPLPSPQSTATSTKPTDANTKGGYYLDDGPGDNAPADIDSIPDATPTAEPPLKYANKPYSALGQKYMPMTTYTPYIKQGVASWYGKRYHGKKTASGEVYDMYAMTGAHTTLPIPSYVRVTNPANGRSVIVRINDRGPFKHDRLIDLSYAAAYKLRLTAQGSGLVEVQSIDANAEALQKSENIRANEAVKTTPVTPPTNQAKIESANYYVQAGAFKNELNGELLQKKIISLDLAGNATVTNVYNNGLYRVKLGPFDTRKEADNTANKIRKQLNTSAIVTNQ